MPANYVLLQRIELNASAASVTFSNIPQSGYTDLKIVMSVRSDAGSNGPGINLSFNGNTSNFSSRILFGNGTSASSYTATQEVATANGGTTTASTFNNGELYIPNYLSSNNKSWSTDVVVENNATLGYPLMYAGLWSNTAAISSVTLTSGSGDFVQYSTFSLYGLAATGTTPVIAPKATGGNITSDGTYWIHTFNSTGTFTPLQGLTCDYLVVAGGGSGGMGSSGGSYAGGGGAGGMRSTVTATGGGGSLESAISVAAQAYTITVGAGGAAVTTAAVGGNSGTASTFSTITSTGGGGGGSFNNAAKNGGSGGGGGEAGSGAAGTGTSGQGYAGGVYAGVGYAGGGGGAGSVGASTAPNPSNGGSGVATSISGTSVTYAAGGKGGIVATVNGTTNTGGGGDGKAGSSGTSGSGGSGIVIIRYPIA